MNSNESNSDLREIFDRFHVSGTFNSADPFGNGHINSTYLIKTKEDSKLNYVLQKINQHVFTEPQKLQENLVKITQYLSNFTHSSLKTPKTLKYLKIFPTHEGNYWFQDNNKEYWRLFNFIDGAVSHNLAKNSKQANEAGKIIGYFQKSLVGFPISHLHETIPNFHNLEMRLATFDQILTENKMNRNKSARNEIDFVQNFRGNLLQIHLAGKSGEIPIRITHNDTKFNNILINNEDHAVSLIDLDTVMPGLIHFDFGDALRIIANTTDEDTQELGLIDVNFEFLDGFVRGYLEESLEFLTFKEIQLLPAAPAMMTFMIGLRFLSDYLDGDHYFKTHYKLHNLQRAKVQFTLVEKFMEIHPKIEKLVHDLS